MEGRGVRFRRRPLKGPQGRFRFSFRRQSHPLVQCELPGLSTVPTSGSLKQAVGRIEIAVGHRFRTEDSGLLRAGKGRLGPAGVAQACEHEGQCCRPSAIPDPVWPHPLDQQKKEGDEEKQGVLVAVVRVGHLCAFALVQSVQGGQEGGKVHKALVGPDIGAAPGFHHRHEHPFIEGGNNGLSGLIGFVALLATIPIVLRNGTARFRCHAHRVDRHTRGGDLLGARQGIVFVVLTIGDDQNDPARFALRIKGFRAQVDGAAHCCPLQRDALRTDGVQEQFHRRQVQGQWRLHIGVARKNNEAHAVAIQLTDDALHRALGQIEPGHPHVFREHGLAHVEGDHDVDAFGLHFFHSGAPFRVHHAQGQRRQCGAPKQELPHGTPRPRIGPQGAA